MTVERTEPPYVLPEREMLDSWLEYHRATLLWKCDGLEDAQLKLRTVEPSSMSLLGLVRHMTEVERNWFRRVLDGQDAPALYYDEANPDGDFDDVDDADVTADLARFAAELDAVRTIAAAHGLDHTGVRRGEEVSLRWIYVHMIEEYARHNGHADLIRERIDGTTGD
jgi:uncharacterized damage-inducible protein DinB